MENGSKTLKLVYMLSSCDYLVDKNNISWLLRKVSGHTILISSKLFVTDGHFFGTI